ncbi:MAG: hypothetical protein IPL59_16260 [Candidatus Competibacteraceae bacterium]|uniref:Uncharacterized protein n=1 Tax=Candidatus Contendobacter odensis Run_B_J11 TaxID=1400861 RepID=A0A7U7G7G6_9GAMM|nr:hypothetical protein [Candidatus Contendobacter odensis]MBK8536538.1 hypothetical protein [Candidatus Competibacteraceae bacterium]MBK8754561.1 hypothetical protein [Candidatus Competibacteraceae bacterium]CDH43152.1 conserved hypothetical protein [Candidatus Contendobacter odensis Run_B_J11]
MLNRPRRSLWHYLLVSSALAWSLGIPILDNSLTLPTAYAHHGGGGAGGGGAGGGGGGKGDGMIRKTPGDGYGKGGRGFQGMKS